MESPWDASLRNIGVCAFRFLCNMTRRWVRGQLYIVTILYSITGVNSHIGKITDFFYKALIRETNVPCNFFLAIGQSLLPFGQKYPLSWTDCPCLVSISWEDISQQHYYANKIEWVIVRGVDMVWHNIDDEASWLNLGAVGLSQFWPAFLFGLSKNKKNAML